MAPGMFFCADCDDRRLLSPETPSRVSCFLCDKPLGCSSDIFMYRGNTPFCSTDCREEQIEMDDAEERMRRKKRSALRTKLESAGSASVRTDTIQVA